VFHACAPSKGEQDLTKCGLSLTNGGLTILVRDGAGNLISEFSYGGSTGLDGGNAQSLTRAPDITGSFVQHTSVAGARKFSPGLKVDGTPFGNCPGHPATVTISPPAGATLWYLVTGANGSTEGPAGNATAGPEVVNSTGGCP